MELQTAIDNRQSIRRFKEGTIPDEDIREIIDAARKAPSGHNLQPWYFVAIKDKALKDKIADAMEAKAAEAADIIREIYVDGTREETSTPFSHGDLPKAATDPEKFMACGNGFAYESQTSSTGYTRDAVPGVTYKFVIVAVSSTASYAQTTLKDAKADALGVSEITPVRAGLGQSTLSKTDTACPQSRFSILS